MVFPNSLKMRKMRYAWNSVNKKYKLNVPFKRYFSHVGKPFKIILKSLGINQSKFIKLEKEFSKIQLDILIK